MDSSKRSFDSKINLFAKIKRSSKYYYQGIGNNDKPQLFQVDEVSNGSHPFRLNYNSYRGDDLTFYVKGLGNQLVKL